jgi:hypothetical protein
MPNQYINARPLFPFSATNTAYQFLYVGALEREAMLADRPKVEQAAQAVFSREGFITKQVPDEHAGGKWRLSYQSYAGQCWRRSCHQITAGRQFGSDTVKCSAEQGALVMGKQVVAQCYVKMFAMIHRIAIK